MLRTITCFLLLFIFFQSFAQQKSDKLTVEKIMRDPKWIGASPSGPSWSNDGSALYFFWNPNNEPADSLYYITLGNKTPVKATVARKQDYLPVNAFVYNTPRTAYVYAKDGDIFYSDIKTNTHRRITQTVDFETNPQFSFNQAKVVYNRNSNLYAWDIATGETMQLTNIRAAEAGSTPAPVTTGFQRGGGGNFQGRGNTANANANQQEDWLKNDQLQTFDVLRTRKEKTDLATAYNNNTRRKDIRSISIDDKTLQGLQVSPDGRFVSYALVRQPATAKNTIVPNYVTESGFTTDINGRTKVGAAQRTIEFFIYDRERDTVWSIKTDSIPGIKDLPDYVKDYPKQLEERKKRNANRRREPMPLWISVQMTTRIVG
jgi:Tol biopolymer transport system component